MNLTGILNENEFYTSHYLSEIFEGDIKSRIDEWNSKEGEDEYYTAPHKQLRSLSGDYFALLQQLGKKSSTTLDKLELSQNFLQRLLHALGYVPGSETVDLGEGSVPLLARVDKADGAPLLWIAEAFCTEACDVLETTTLSEQLGELDETLKVENYDEIITTHIFTLDEPPRWVMLISAFQIVLIDRAKWAQKRFLRFDLQEIFGRKEDVTLKAMSVLLHSDSLAPKDGMSLLDTLDENSHKHAFGVTEDLKYALRESIEILANEAIYYKLQKGEEVLSQTDLDAQLSRESLRYMYRLLFLFYIESRPELGYVPVKSSAYLQGYSLENLRDLELMPLLTDSDKNGYFFHDSIQLLFEMIYEGRSQTTRERNGQNLFEISPLRSHLFDPDHTPFLDGVKIRNHVWQSIIQSLSLSRPGKGKKGRGRISYANLGINQLGAVYEALLSYKGFIATETLYEVKKAGTNPTPLENAYFVTEAQLPEYKEEERVFEKGKLVKYQTGTFIYRLAGRDREKSASYYTPEVLTKSLVKYALKELLQDKTADEILNLTVCEPAMGSAAFLNEAINQLSEAYLQQKQIETGERIAHDKYILERQKVKMYIADNNVFGVDLNPTAVELAEISLWLNALFADDNQSFIPWFGLQLVNGNSLIGARRQVYEVSQVTTTKKALIWYEDAPKRLSPKSLWPAKKRVKKTVAMAHHTDSLFGGPEQRPLVMEAEETKEEKSAGRKVDSQIYHFLLGDKAMSDYSDKVVKALKKEEIEHIKEWRKEFIKPHSAGEMKILLKLSSSIDKLWQEHTRHQHEMRVKTTDPLKVWGQPESEFSLTNLKFKDQVLEQERHSKSVKSSSPYRRLKLAMDYWCTLWFWPIDDAKLLPTRAQFFEDISRLVDKRGDIMMDLDKDLFSETMDDEERVLQMDELGFIDVEELVSKNERLQVVEKVSDAQKFLHWELEFADIFSKQGGFDLILGNPPWLQVKWEESGIMGEINPLFDIRKFSASKLNQLREETFENYTNLEKEYIAEYEGSSATQTYLATYSNYPILDGKVNLYKCFLPTAWMFSSKKGVVGYLHPEGVYDDPKGGRLRAEIYKRLKYHFQFFNESKLFQEVHNQTLFSINVFTNFSKEIYFETIANLYLPQTIDTSFEYNGDKIVGGIKDDNNKWNIQGHHERIIPVNSEVLKLFAKLYDEEGTHYKSARLPAIHAVGLLRALERFSMYPKRLLEIKGKYHSTTFFDETQSQTDGIIERNTTFVKKPEEVILSGPHFFVANPVYKVPKRICNTNKAWGNNDLTNLKDNYLPRTNYVPKVSDYNTRIPTIDFGNGCKKITDYYRLFFRIMLSQAGERTLISSITPKGYGHIHAIRSFAFYDNDILLKVATFSCSIIADYFTKSTGLGNLGNTILEKIPLLGSIKLQIRTLSLSCFSVYYDELYREQFDASFKNDNWTKKDDPRLNQNFFKNLTPNWQRNVALRTDYERRQALVEIDVLVAQELKLTLEELKTIYRIQFPVLKQNENETYYDMNGRIIFTVSKGLTGVGLPRKAVKGSQPCKIIIDGIEEEKVIGWEDIADMQEGEIYRTITDDTQPNGPIERTIIYKAPFAKCNREEDYEIAWAEFERRGM